MFQAIKVAAVGFPGSTELLIIFGIIVFIFGANRIPDLAKSLGSGIRGFQKSIKGEDEQPSQVQAEVIEGEAEEASQEAPPEEQG